MSRLRQLTVSLTCAAAVGFAIAKPAPAHADPARANEAASALLEIRDADPLELWRVARRVGDEALLPLLDASRPPGVRLAAARVAPFLIEPELALLPLCAMITSRDSDLAPAAARSVLQIARGLDPLELARRELSPLALGAAREALDRIVEQHAVRADLGLMAAAAAAQLRALGLPPAPPHK